MHLREGPDKGHTSDREREREMQRREKSSTPSGIQTNSLSVTRRVLYRCATTAVQIFQVEFVRDALLKLFPESIVSKLDSKIPDVRKWTDFVKLLLKSEKQINSFLEASSQVHQDLFLS